MKTFSGLVTTIVLGHCVCLCGWAMNTDFNRYGEIIPPPPLPAPQGEIIRVSTAEALYDAVDRVGTGTTRTEIVNNLVHGEIRIEGGEARLSQKV